MTMKYHPTLFVAGQGTLYLPPFERMPLVRPIKQQVVEDVPFFGPSFDHNQQVGWEIEFSGAYFVDDPVTGLELQDTIRAFMIDGSSNGRIMEMAIWTDSDANIARYYRDLNLLEWPEFGDSRTERNRQLSFVLQTANVTRYTAFSDASTPGTDGPYEKYYYGSTVTTTGGETDLISAQQYILTLPMSFGGGIQELPSANINFLQVARVPGPTGATMRLQEVIHSGTADIYTGGGLGDSVMRVSTTDHNSAGNGIDITLNSASYGGTTATGSVDFTAGDLIYMYPTTAGAHVNPSFTLEFLKV